MLGEQNYLHSFTSEELIRELLNRTTFVGIIIKSENEAKNTQTRHKHFVVNASDNLNPHQVYTVLDSVAQQMRSILPQELQ